MCHCVWFTHNSLSRSDLMSLVVSLSPISGQVQSRLALLETQVRQREEERSTLHSKLQANQEEIAQVHQEVSTSVGKQKDPFALRQYIAMVMEAEKARTENAQNWVQVKSLMRFMKQQQTETDRQER